jgi:hypothetical protein
MRLHDAPTRSFGNQNHGGMPRKEALRIEIRWHAMLSIFLHWNMRECLEMELVLEILRFSFGGVRSKK